MKKPLLLLLIIPAIAAVALPSKVLFHVDTYKVDTKLSKIEWFAEKVTGKHTGTIIISSGDVNNNHGQLGGKFTIDMTTINVTDLQGDKKGKLEGHLNSEDFFNVSKFPVSTFEITSVVPKTGVVAGEPNFLLSGKLTIKGITNAVSFPALIKFDGTQMLTKAEVKVDRSKFDIRYGSKSFFPNIGDKAISDEFILKLDIVAIR